ncbi:KDGP aldolase, partial [Enterococcus faecalis]|uniref:KDGP aldolase n=1 Tax=Enterococcus faecalis TaxID=1351 RepID=UPI003D09F924
NSVENAQACYEAAEGHVVLGVLSKNYETDEAAIDDMKKYQAATNNALSVGLGAGDPNQSQMVARLSEVLQPQHVNQVFTGVGASRALLRQDETVINGLVSPTGKVGYVNIATGPLSSGAPAAEVPIETAIKLLKDMGGSSIKYFEEIVQIAVDAGVKKIIPHVYSSIIDQETGDTRTEDVKTLLTMMKNTLV